MMRLDGSHHVPGRGPEAARSRVEATLAGFRAAVEEELGCAVTLLVFGSFARSSWTDASDLDLAIIADCSVRPSLASELRLTERLLSEGNGIRLDSPLYFFSARGVWTTLPLLYTSLLRHCHRVIGAPGREYNEFLAFVDGFSAADVAVGARHVAREFWLTLLSLFLRICTGGNALEAREQRRWWRRVGELALVLSYLSGEEIRHLAQIDWRDMLSSDAEIGQYFTSTELDHRVCLKILAILSSRAQRVQPNLV